MGSLRAGNGWARRVAFGGAGAVLVDQFGRLLGRRAHEHEGTPSAARDGPRGRGRHGRGRGSGYTAAPQSETVLFNLLAGFLGSFTLVRLST